jgi:hypothetical protein
MDGKRWLAIACLATVGLGLAPARSAAGPVERLVQVLLHPAQPEVIAVRYEYGGGGLVVSRDGGRSFRLLCGAAMNLDGERVTSAALTGDGQLALGTFTGTLRDDGRACGFARDAVLAGSWVTDVVAHPADPSVTFAVTGKAEPQENGIFRREAGGEYERFGSFAPRLITRMRIALLPDGALRFYQSALHGTVDMDPGNGPPPVPSYVLRVSDDAGQTWSEQAFPAGAGSLRLEAVDPADPDRIVVSALRPEGEDSVLISDDAGATFRELVRVAALGGVVMTGDGRVFIADAGDPTMPKRPAGLWRASDGDPAASRLPGSDRVLCLGYDKVGDVLYGCHAFTFGVLDVEDGSLQPLLDFRYVQEFVACDGVDMVTACESQLDPEYCHVSHYPCAPVCAGYPVEPALRDELDCPVWIARAAAGAPPEASPGPQPEAPSEPPRDAPRPGPCSVAVPGSAAGDAPAAVCALLLALLLVRRAGSRARPQREQRSARSSSPPPGS